MLKNILLSLSLVFLLSSPAYADVLDFKAKKEEIKSERQQLQEEIETATGKQKIDLIIKDNRLINFENAYDKAIELIEDPIISQGNNNFNNFVPLIRPGETVPSAFIPYYKAAGEKYGVDWTVLAAIHKIETNYSRIRIMVSSVGAIGDMQFMPSTFARYGVDGNGDGVISPWNVQDSIFSAAHYLASNNFKNNPRGAIWHYNHAIWYVNDVLKTAAIIKGSN